MAVIQQVQIRTRIDVGNVTVKYYNGPHELHYTIDLELSERILRNA